MREEPWIDRLKVITATRAVVVQASLNLSLLQGKGSTNKEREIPSAKKNARSQQRIKHTKI